MLLGLLDEIGVEYAVIGGHAVNAWLEPRFTADVDVTVHAAPAVMAHLRMGLEDRGYRVTREDGAELASGPDFVRFASDGGITLDLLVLKLIANRAKDRIDLLGLAQLDGLDWEYVERWAEEWEVGERLRAVRVLAR